MSAYEEAANKRFDPEYYYRKAQGLRELTSLEDFESWLNSPLTRALLIEIEGQISELASNWLNNQYENPTEDAKARGALQAMEIIGRLMHAHPGVEEAA